MHVLALAQLVSRSEAESAKTRAILWTVFAVVMGIVFIYKLVRLGNKESPSLGRRCGACGAAAKTTDTACARCGSPDLQ